MNERPIFAIFEGGGAKGVAHVGAVAACERNDIYFVGVAGASAGALAASLVAIGFSADELLDPTQSGANILAKRGMSPISLLGQTDWLELNTHRHTVEQIFAKKGFVAKACAALPKIPSVWRYASVKWADKGLMTTASVREFLNTLLYEKVVELRDAMGLQGPIHPVVTFADIDHSRFGGRVIPLKIIGTNVSTRELWVFDKDMTPDVEVALAVSASIAIPGAFKPVEIAVEGTTMRFVDGGVVSNLPIWVFNNEKLAFERANPSLGPVPIVGFTLREKQPAPSTASVEALTETEQVTASPDSMFAYLGSVVQTSLSGSQAVTQRFVQDLTVAPLHTSLTLLKFDANEAEILNAYHDGFRCADVELRHALIERPRLVQEQLARIHQIVRQGVLKLIPPAERRRKWRLRVSVVERFGLDTFRVTFGHNMDEDADDRLLLDDRGRGAPAAYKTKAVRLIDVGAAWSQPQADYMTKYERALVPTSMQSILCVPIFPNTAAWQVPAEQKPTPCGVLSIDCSRSLQVAYNDSNFMALLLSQSTLLFSILTQEPKRGK